MAELLPQERLQPALLDRLLDDQPEKRKPEPIEQRVMSRTRLRQAVLRDLTWLFNSVGWGTRLNAVAYPHVARSVFNYGLPPLSGETASTLDVVDLERAVKQAIRDYEPRIEPGTLEVQAVASEAFLDRHNVITIQIRGTLWAQPMPLEILLRTDMDLETGEVRVEEVGRGR